MKFLLLLFPVFRFSRAAVSENEVISSGKETYSAAPSNIPVTRVYVFGKPVYIRQPFVIPQRNISYGTQNYAVQHDYDDKEMVELLSKPNLFERKGRYREGRQTGREVKYRDDDGYNDGYPEAPRPKYPLKQCYTEKSGFMCCNRQLEKVMRTTVDNLTAKRLKNCNIQAMSNALQTSCEREFGTHFETITGVGDFASKIHFFSDYVCKMEMNGRVLLAYATPNRHNNYAQYPTLSV